MHRHVKRIVDHLWGPFGSVLLHIIVIVLLVKFVTFVQKVREPDVEVVIVEPEAVDLDELMEPEELEETPEEVETIEPPDVNFDMEAPTDVEDLQQTEPLDDFAALDVMSDVQSPLVMKGLFAGRSASGRAAALGRYNKKYAEITERAVIRALEWLKKHQEPDGSWSNNGNDRQGLTGLGLLTFLAHGETPSSEQYGATVEKAIRFLVSSQLETGMMASPKKAHANVYNHAIATYGLAEAYGLTRIPSIKPVLEKAVDVIIRGQQDHGGWDYNYEHTGRNDSSIDGWQIQALKAAYAAGIHNPQLKPAMNKALAGLAMLHNEEKGETYYSMPVKDPGGNDGLTAISALCYQLLGHSKDPIVKRGLERLSEADCAWGNNTYKWPYYAWYYIAQAKFHSGEGWNNWNARMVKTLTGCQNEDGSWPTNVPHPSDKNKGEDSDAGTHTKDFGPVYSTTLAALSLQVYYRFLPSYKADAVQDEGGDEGDVEDDDVEIQVI